MKFGAKNLTDQMRTRESTHHFRLRVSQGVNHHERYDYFKLLLFAPPCLRCHSLHSTPLHPHQIGSDQITLQHRDVSTYTCASIGRLDNFVFSHRL